MIYLKLLLGYVLILIRNLGMHKLYVQLKMSLSRCRHCTEFEPIWSELAELVNTKDSKFAIAQIDCTRYSKLCQAVDITGII